MRIAHCWGELTRGVADALALLAFRRRMAGRCIRWIVGGLLVVTMLVVLVPVFDDRDAPRDLLAWLWIGLPVLTIGGSISLGGGRALLPREEAVAFPVSRAAEYVGSLLLAPLNMAWLVQVWMLLGLTADRVGTDGLLPALAVTVAWVVFSTVLGQTVGWGAEWVRRGPAGPVGQRVLLALGAGALLLVLRDGPPDLAGQLLGASGAFFGLLGLSIAIALLGLAPACRALALPARDEERLDTATHLPRASADSDLRMLLRLDRASLWRTVPVRRGILLLALMPLPGAFAPISWDLVVLAPGLVGSGAVLLFGVNVWTLDGRGLMWRESLPVSPRVVLCSRALLLLEVAVATALPGILVLGWRAGPPNGSEVAALFAAWLVCSTMIVSSGLRWSMDRPYPVDLRSARATPAPPIVMVGYAARLSVATSLVGLLLAAGIWPTLLVGVVSVARLWRTVRRWSDPVQRSRVIALVSA